MARHMMVFEDLQHFSLSLEGNEMEDNTFECFVDIIMNMTNLKSLKLNINKCYITEDCMAAFSDKLGDMKDLESLEIIAKRNNWEPKKRDAVYEGFTDLMKVAKKKLDF